MVAAAFVSTTAVAASTAARKAIGALSTSDLIEGATAARERALNAMQLDLAQAQLEMQALEYDARNMAMVRRLPNGAIAIPVEALQNRAPRRVALEQIRRASAPKPPAPRTWKNAAELFALACPGQDWRRLPPSVRALFEVWAR